MSRWARWGRGTCWQLVEERMMGLQKEADWFVATTGQVQEVVRWGRHWGANCFTNPAMQVKSTAAH